MFFCDPGEIKGDPSRRSAVYTYIMRGSMISDTLIPIIRLRGEFVRASGSSQSTRLQVRWGKIPVGTKPDKALALRYI